MREGLSKVPLITAYFWIVKLLSTAMGEATSDYLVHRFNPYLAVIGGFLVFLVAILLQFRASRYRPWVYWSAVVMVAVFGTMAADVLHVEFKVPYIVSTLFFAVCLTIVFTVWHRSEGTLSIHSITTRRRESSTGPPFSRPSRWERPPATSPPTPSGSGSSPPASSSPVSSLLPAIGYRFFHLNAILAFWTAYVLTRPLGASFADWLGKSRHAGGLGFGDGPVAFVLDRAHRRLRRLPLGHGHRRPDEGASRAAAAPGWPRRGGLEPSLGEESSG